jgi:hypothetical protein
VLAEYSLHEFPTEGDLVLKTIRTFGSDVDPNRTPTPIVVLAALADSSWANSLPERGLADGVCYSEVQACPDSILSTFLTLRSPEARGDSSWAVHVHEVGTNPTICRSEGMFLGTMDREFIVEVRRESWRVQGIEFRGGSSGFCSP